MHETYDVFISYARADSDRAKVIRDLLVAKNLNVFFDTEGIDTGEEFPVVIDRAVKSAKCVLGLWSHHAFSGRWVRIESRIGLDQRKLVAAVLDDTEPEELPAEFYNVNVESLVDFNGQKDHEGWARILRAIGRRVERADLAGAPAPPRPQRRAPAPQREPDEPRASSSGGSNGLIWAGGGALIAALLAFAAWQYMGGGAPKPGITPNAEIATPADPSLPDTSADDVRAEQARLEALAREARWRDGCEAGDIAACRGYLADFRDGAYAQQAAARIEELTRPVAADLTGAWSGYYAQDSTRTVFTAEFSGSAGAFRGRVTEPNTFGDRSAPRLFANVSGRTTPDGAVNFVKTYDGTGGVTHSVQYQGRLDAAGRTITGTWSTGGLRGQFQMSRR